MTWGDVLDSEEYTKNKVLNWIFNIGLIVLSAISWFLDLSSFFPNYDWRHFAIIFSIIFIVSSIIRISKLESVLSSKTPNIVIHEGPYIVEWMIMPKSWYVSGSENQVHREVPKFALVSFSNEPKIPTELNHAKKLTVKLIYNNNKGDIIVGPIYANWGGFVDDSGNRKQTDYIFHDLESNGFPKAIIFAIKYDSSESCFAFNYDNFHNYYRTNHDYAMTAREINVEIHITGERVNKKFNCTLINNGIGFPLLVE